MEEKKTLKIKKPYVIIITLAIVFAILGFMDLNVWAMENYDVNVLLYDYSYDSLGNETVTLSNEKTITFNSKVDLYYYTTSDIKFTGDYRTSLFAVGSQPFSNYDISVQVGNELKYVSFNLYPSASYCNNGFSKFEFTGNYNKIYKLNNDYDQNGFANALRNGSVDCKEIIDYSKLQVDDDMATIKNLKRNVIEYSDTDGDFSVAIYSLYDYLTWDNEMVENWELELQIAPVVQYYKISLSKNTFVKEFVGDWYSKEIFTDVTNKYLNKCYDLSDKDYAIENYDIYKFYTDCNDKYSKGMFEESYIYYGYRFRYIDKENLKCSPWVVLMPSNVKDSYDVFVEYSDSSITDNGSGDGIHNKYDDLENLDDAMTDVDTENKFIEEYGPTISNGVNVDEATNWLQSVATFIKGTPAFVGSVLSFLPQPILYGIYICIFLGVIAGGYAIIKALI